MRSCTRLLRWPKWLLPLAGSLFALSCEPQTNVGDETLQITVEVRPGDPAYPIVGERMVPGDMPLALAHKSRSSRFPYLARAVSEERNGRHYRGLYLEGMGHQVTALVSDQSNEGGPVQVLVESTLALQLRVVWLSAEQRSPPSTFTKQLAPGRHELDIQEPAEGESQKRKTE